MQLKAISVAIFLVSVAVSIDTSPSQRSLEIRGGQWFTGKGFVRQHRIYVVDGYFTRRRPPKVDSIIELGDSFVVPPFADAHEHIFTSRSSVENEIRHHLEKGIFYSLSLTGSAAGKRDVASEVNRPASVDVAYAEALTSTRGHPILSAEVSANRVPWDSLGTYWPRLLVSNRAEGDVYFRIDSLADLDRKWPNVLANQPDIIKIYLLDSRRFSELRRDTMSIGHTGLDPSLVPAIVRRSDQAGLRVAAHVETAEDFRIAASAGVDIIAHLPGLSPKSNESASRYALRRSDAAVARKMRVTVLPTAWLAERLATARPWLSGDAAGIDTAQLNRAQALQRRNLELLAAAGVNIGIGSDLFADATTEAIYLGRLGVFDNLSILRMLSEKTPQVIFPRRRIGKLAPGYEGSFLALKCNPLEQLGCVNQVTARIKQGHVIEAGDSRGAGRNRTDE